MAFDVDAQDSTGGSDRNRMPFLEHHYRWQWHLKSSPEALWPFVADSNRTDYDTRLPSLERLPGPRPALPGANRVRFRMFGVPLEWEEEPFEWVRPHRLGVMRRYARGPVAHMRVLIELAPGDGGGTRLIYQVWIRPKNLIGLLGIPVQVGVLSRRAFGRAFRRYDRVASLPQPSPLALVTQVNFAPGGRERLAALRRELIDNGANPDLVARLADVIETADDIFLARLRPYELADRWGAPRRQVLELCLWATRVGLLEFQWDLLCPLCRNARETSTTLNSFKSQVHCDSCNIDVTANFDRSVELTFRPNPAVRRSEVGEFCAGSPHLTPHIVAQQLVSAGETRTLKLPLEEGRYRLRILNAPGGQYLRAARDGADELSLHARPGNWPNDEPGLGLTPTVHFVNDTDATQLMILERMTWTDKAVTAAEVTATQLFRDLFSSEALRPGEQISVGSITVLFTDLRESTRLYREVGDAVAFGRVMTHFDILRDAIDAEQGALVKTIGDAVMAVFVHPLNAVRAILRAQHELAHPGASLPTTPPERSAGRGAPFTDARGQAPVSPRNDGVARPLRPSPGAGALVPGINGDPGRAGTADRSPEGMDAERRPPGASLTLAHGSAGTVEDRPPGASLTLAHGSAGTVEDRPPGDLLPLQLKAGIHYGPCIAVTLNGRLDYFGTTVNIAARLEGQSPSGGIVVSSSVRRDPEVSAYFEDVQHTTRVEPFQGQLKGFGDELFELWRVTPQDPMHS